MPSLLLSVFLVQLVIHIVNSVGVTAIAELAWHLYNKLPTPTSTAVAKCNRQRAELLRLKKELSSVSAQDDFARWAKLRRQHDKVNDDHNATAASLQASKGKFTTAVTTVRWVSTNGLRLFLLYWYSRAALFWIPREWVPGWVEWVLSWPRAPLGSVSVQVWSVACGSVIAMGGEAAGAVWALAVMSREKTSMRMNESPGGRKKGP